MEKRDFIDGGGKLNIKTILEHARRDKSTNIDIPHLLSTIEKSEYLENKTLDSIFDEKIQILGEITNNKELIATILGKLTDYRRVKNIYDLHNGKHIRWIKKGKSPIVLERGAIVSGMLYTDRGTNIQCRRYDQRIFQIRMDEYIIFQKMNEDELLVLALQEKIKNT